MPKLTLIPMIALMSVFTGSAIAQDAEPEPGWNVQPDVAVDHFTVADADADDAINRTEFELYVSSRAEGGDVRYIEIRDSGDYDRYFTEKDVNADGLLEKDELTPVQRETMSDPAIIDDPDMIDE